MGQVWSLGRLVFFLWRSLAEGERGAAWPCCEGRRAGVQGPCLSVETVRGMVLLWLMAQERERHKPTRSKTKSEDAGQLLLLDRPFLFKPEAAHVSVARVIVRSSWSPLKSFQVAAQNLGPGKLCIETRG